MEPAGQAVERIFREESGRILATLILFGIVLIPLGMTTFAFVERWAKKTGQLKRQG